AGRNEGHRGDRVRSAGRDARPVSRCRRGCERPEPGVRLPGRQSERAIARRRVAAAARAGGGGTKMTLRRRRVHTLVPLLTLLAILGIAGTVLLLHLGNRIDAILRENYDSVLAMERLNEALERIDSSFQFALAGREDAARASYSANWKLYLEQLDVE